MTFEDAVNSKLKKTIGVPVSILSFAIYIPLQIAFIPFALLGFVLVAYRQIVVSKNRHPQRRGVRQTRGRLAQHVCNGALARFVPVVAEIQDFGKALSLSAQLRS